MVKGKRKKVVEDSGTYSTKKKIVKKIWIESSQ